MKNIRINIFLTFLLIFFIPKFQLLAGCISGDCTNEYGIYTWSNGMKYEGEWDNGKKHGQGIYIWPSGHKYDGEWKNDKMYGRGTYYYPGGQKYTGEYENGKKHGQGTYTWPNGQKYIGEYENEKRHGYGKMTLSDGTVQEGEWKNDEFVKSVKFVEKISSCSDYLIRRNNPVDEYQSGIDFGNCINDWKITNKIEESTHLLESELRIPNDDYVKFFHSLEDPNGLQDPFNFYIGLLSVTPLNRQEYIPYIRIFQMLSYYYIKSIFYSSRNSFLTFLDGSYQFSRIENEARELLNSPSSLINNTKTESVSRSVPYLRKKGLVDQKKCKTHVNFSKGNNYEYQVVSKVDYKYKEFSDFGQKEDVSIISASSGIVGGCFNYFLLVIDKNRLTADAETSGYTLFPHFPGNSLRISLNYNSKNTNEEEQHAQEKYLSNLFESTLLDSFMVTNKTKYNINGDLDLMCLRKIEDGHYVFFHLGSNELQNDNIMVSSNVNDLDNCEPLIYGYHRFSHNFGVLLNFDKPLESNTRITANGIFQPFYPVEVEN
jgi:hypothetical protein